MALYRHNVFFFSWNNRTNIILLAQKFSTVQCGCLYHFKGAKSGFL